MPVDADLASLSDNLFTLAIAIYSFALVCYCGEYAFGRRGRVAQTSAVEEKVLVGAGGPPATITDDVAEEPIAEAPAGPDRARRFAMAAVGLTAIGAAVHLASVVVRGVAVHRVPWGNMYEFTSAMGFVAVAAFLAVIVWQPRVRYLGLFVMLPVLLFMFLAGTVLYVKAGPLTAPLRSYWIAIHVSAAIIATGIFLVSFMATLLYLVRRRYDQAVAAGKTPTRFPTTIGWRLPEAGVLDRVAYRTVAFAFPVFTFGIAAGAIWAEAAWGRYWGWDPKETWSFIAWVVYAAYLHARATAGWKGVKAARINLLAFGCMLFNFFVVNVVISGMHSYSGL